MKRTLLALAAVIIASSALAAGNFTGLPAAVGPGTPSIGAPTTGGGPITQGCIPMDTGNVAGINPATQCVSPSQLAAASAGAALSYSTAKVDGTVPLASLGNDTTPVAGTLYVAALNLPAFTVTNISCLNGSAAATDRLIYALYNASGVLVANTTTASQGTVAAGVNGWQAQIALTTPYVAAAGLYFVGYTANGTTTRFRTITANGAGDLTASYAGTAGAVAASIVPPTGFVNNVGPICYAN